MPMLTPNQAAAAVGKSRRSIMRAITAGEITARRTNDGWKIDELDLDAWANAHAQRPVLSAQLEKRIRGLEMLLDEVRASNATLRASNDDLRADRDAWRAMVQRPWWKRLAG